MKSFISIFFSLFVFTISTLSAQEIVSNVMINSEKVETTEKTVFTTMKNDITSFINTRKWTNDDFNTEERIKVNIFLTLTEGNVVNGTYQANLQIQATRPVYNSNYETVILNFLDKNFIFEYLPSQPMYFNENSFLNNLTSNLGYYMYIILGMDYDSFSPLGGTPYFEKARSISNIALASGQGWNESEMINRIWLQENFNSQQFLPFREGFYKYHRHSLDGILKNADTSRVVALEFLRSIKQVNIQKPSSIVLKTFFFAKNDELVNLFSKGDRKVREEASLLLRELDPLNTEKYLKILKNN